MAMCSYQTIARYDDYSRSRNLDEIRRRERKTLYDKRFIFKCKVMYQNRPTLAQVIHDECDTPSQLDLTADAAKWAQDDTNGWDSPAPSDQTSPTPTGSSTSSSSIGIQAGEYYYPAYLFETPGSQRSASGSPGTSNDTTRSNTRQNSYKSGSQPCRSTRSKERSVDSAKVKSDYITLKETISNCHGDSEYIGKILVHNWQTFLDALQLTSNNLASEASELLSHLATNNQLHSTALLYMLQNGLVFSLRDTVWKGDINGAIKLTMSIIQSTPSAIPYIVDLMASSGLLAELENWLQLGDTDDLRIISEFYYFVSEHLMSYVYNGADTQPTPLLPEILLITGVTHESFSPMATLTKCLTPNLIIKAVDKCLERGNQKDEDLLKMSLVLLANILKLAYVKNVTSAGDGQWIVDILKGFRSSMIEDQVQSLIRGLERLMKNSEASDHCSQGMGIDNLALRISDMCQQFMSFYKQYYGLLSSSYSHQMNE